MTYDISVQTRQDYLRVEVSGQRIPGHEVGDALDVWKKTAVKVRETGVNRILLIGKVPGRIPAAAANLAVKLAEQVQSRVNYKVAMVFTDLETLDSHNLTTTFARNLGYEVDIFDNETDARKWLCSN